MCYHCATNPSIHHRHCHCCIVALIAIVLLSSLSHHPCVALSLCRIIPVSRHRYCHIVVSWLCHRSRHIITFVVTSSRCRGVIFIIALSHCWCCHIVGVVTLSVLSHCQCCHIVSVVMSLVLSHCWCCHVVGVVTLSVLL